MTDAIDWTQPIELETGSPAEVLRVDESNEMAYVQISEPHYKSGRGDVGPWWYETATGEWAYDPEGLKWKVRNVDQGPPVCEDWS